MGTILIVDASLADARDCQRILEARGFATAVHGTPHGVVDLTLELAPCLVVVDEFLPSLHGLQVIRDLSRHPGTGHIPVLMTASRTRTPDKIRALWQGARDYLVKPLEEDRLLRVVESLVDVPGPAVPIAAGSAR